MTDKERENLEKAKELIQARLDGSMIKCRNLNSEEWRDTAITENSIVFYFNYCDYRAVFPKLDRSVFDREDCPKWANYVAVDEDGECFAFNHEPYIEDERWVINDKYTWEDYEYKRIPSKFDASNWKNSLIKRERLPKWCKVGETIIVSGDYIAKIDIITGKKIGVTFDTGDTATLDYDNEQLQPAIFEPLTADEIEKMLPVDVISIALKLPATCYKMTDKQGVKIVSHKTGELYCESIELFVKTWNFKDGSPIGKYRPATKKEMEEME